MDEAQRLEEALVCYEEAIRLNPRDADAHINKGNLLQAKKENLTTTREMQMHTSTREICCGYMEDAYVCYEEAIRLNPRDADAHINKGSLLQAMGYMEDALWCYEEAIRLNPAHVHAQCCKRKVLLSMGRLEDALLCYEEKQSKWILLMQLYI
eukprot:TRINITY_DN23636_c1_g1_i1.p1 TRINITY_DN23636_c1_g1~~TRINITY_DN23636_c1_g1_i1.p1  ORF type:complete len:162 (-),score=23.93 TRINITY_DN23636_c1_g1_i1:283-741(-)